MVDDEAELEEFSRIFEDLEDHRDEIERELAVFLDGHPTFADEFAVYDETPNAPDPSIISDRLDNYDSRTPVTSEWAFIFKYGYMKGLFEANSKMHHQTDVPYEDSDSEEE